MKICIGIVMVMLTSIGAARGQAIVPDGAQVERIADGFKFTEGPAWDGRRYVYFSDIPNARIHRYDTTNGRCEVFRENSGGANGLIFDGQGRLVMCQGQARQVGRLDADGNIATLAAQYEGQTLNSPNDLEIDAHGGVYFTDPRYGKRDDMQMNIEGVYYIAPDEHITRVIDDMVRPNGLILSNDGKALYVIDNAAGKVFAYDVGGDGLLSGKRLFVALNDEKKSDGDGMAIDTQGNLYITSPNTSSVQIVSPAGQVIGKIDCPLKPTNCTFGDADKKTLYITARTSLFRITLNATGRD